MPGKIGPHEIGVGHNMHVVLKDNFSFLVVGSITDSGLVLCVIERGRDILIKLHKPYYSTRKLCLLCSKSK
jgi:hypothetical protein